MTPTKKDPEKRIKAERSAIMHIISSPKLTLVLGIVAFFSIVYYKVYIAPPEKKTDTSLQPAERITAANIPIVNEDDILGRTRPNGPLLSRSFFRTGDLAIIGSAQNRKWGIIHKTTQGIKVVHPQIPEQDLLKWLVQHDGRFALYRVFPPSQQISEQLEKDIAKIATDPSPLSPDTLPSNSLATIIRLYQDMGIKLPSLPQPPSTQENWLQILIEQSHYNDLLKPPPPQ
jgi:hypothetical protein